MPNGSWDCDTTEPHTFDAGLFRGIIAFCREFEVTSVIDLGCGSGQYVTSLNEAGVKAVGYDGNPNTAKFAARCQVADVTGTLPEGMADMVLSLEVGEHIPGNLEQEFLNNVTGHAVSFVVLSWFPTPGHGIGHVNERSNEWVIARMLERGFVHMPEWTETIRLTSTKWWFSYSLLCFTRK